MSTAQVVSPLQYNDIDLICRKAKTIVVECAGCGRVVSGRHVHLPMIAYGFWCSRCCPCRAFIASRQEADVIELRRMMGEEQEVTEERRFVVIEPVVKAAVVSKQSGLEVAKAQEKLAKDRAARAEAKEKKAEAKAERLKAKAAKMALVKVAHKAADKLLNDRRYRIAMPDFGKLDAEVAVIARRRFVAMRRLRELDLSPEERRELGRQRMSAAAPAACEKRRNGQSMQRSEETRRRMSEAAKRRWADSGRISMEDKM
jgi:hypothetical protein